MISSASFSTQTDFFARLLSQKLKNLDNDSKLEKLHGEIQIKGCNSQWSSSDRYKLIFDNGVYSSERIRPTNDQLLGTTFPPNKFVSCDLIRAKFQKESKLLLQIHEKGQKMDIPEVDNQSHPIDAPHNNVNIDNEMLFDFDIGSPQTPDETSSFENIIHDIELDSLNITYSNSDRFLQNISSVGESTSSGLFSEPFTPSPSEKGNFSGLDDLDENCLLPKEWFKNHLNPTDDLNPKALTPVASKQELPKHSNTTVMKNQDLEESEEGFEDFKVSIGTELKSVASSKLEALLSQLQSDSNPIEETQMNRKLNASKITSTSPANFSYLKGSDQTGDDLDESRSVLKSLSVFEMSEHEKSVLLGDSEGKNEVLDGSKSQVEEDSSKKHRKCSSLRSGKTPPSTPGRRKIVRFADIFGLDLADVKTFFDEIPKVPKSAFKDLKDADLSDLDSDSGSEIQSSSAQNTTSLPTGPTISPLFNQPGGSSEFFNILRDKKVCLENAYMSDEETIRGTVRVVNLDFNKKISLNYTFDDWKTSATLEGIYIEGSCDGFSDKFTFLLDYSPISGMIGKRLQFCIKFDCLSFEYWDNNFGRNYIFQVFGPAVVPTPATVTPTPSLEPASLIKPFVPRSSGRRSGFRRKSTAPIIALPTPIQTCTSVTHFSTFSHSPSTSDDPWLRY